MTTFVVVSTLVEAEVEADVDAGAGVDPEEVVLTTVVGRLEIATWV